MFFSKKNDDEGGKKVKLSQRGNPSARPMLTRIYGILGCLAVTLFLIGLMILLEKTLPDGSKSDFHPTWRRDNSLEPRIPAQPPAANNALAFGGGAIIGSLLFTVEVSTSSAAPAITLAPIFNPLGVKLPCFTTETHCSTVTIFGKLRARQQYNVLECSTHTQAIACSPTPTPTPSLTIIPIVFNPSLLSIACSSTQVACSTVNIPGKLRARYNVVECTTSTQTFACPSATPTPVSSTTSTVSVSRSSNPCITSTVACPIIIGKRQVAPDCVTSYWTAASCLSSSSQPVLTPTSSLRNSGGSITSLPTITPSSLPPCMTSTVSCTPVVVIDPTNSRQQLGSDCTTSFSSIPGCGVTTSKSSSIKITPTLSSSSISMSSSLPPCTTSTVSCPALIPKRQFQGCVTSFYTIPGCGINSTSSIASPTITPTSSLPSCMTSTVSCTTLVVTDPIIGKRQLVPDCATSFLTIPGCGITTSSKSSSAQITPSLSSNSSSLITPTPTLTPSTVSSNYCLSTGASCTTVPSSAGLGAVIAAMGGFFNISGAPSGGAPGPVINCVTTVASITGCGVILTSNSSSSVTTPPTSLRSSTSSIPPVTPIVSVSLNSSSKISSPIISPTTSTSSSLSASSSSSLPVSVVTPSTNVSVPMSLSSTSSLFSASSSSLTAYVINSSTSALVRVSSSIKPSLASPTPSSSLSVFIVTPSASVFVPLSSSSVSNSTTMPPSPSSSISSGTPSSSPVFVVTPSTSVFVPVSSSTSLNPISASSSTSTSLSPGISSSSLSVIIVNPSTSSFVPISSPSSSITISAPASSSASAVPGTLSSASPVLIITPSTPGSVSVLSSSSSALSSSITSGSSTPIPTVPLLSTPSTSLITPSLSEAVIPLSSSLSLLPGSLTPSNPGTSILSAPPSSPVTPLPVSSIPSLLSSGSSSPIPLVSTSPLPIAPVSGTPLSLSAVSSNGPLLPILALTNSITPSLIITPTIPLILVSPSPISPPVTSVIPVVSPSPNPAASSGSLISSNPIISSLPVSTPVAAITPTSTPKTALPSSLASGSSTLPTAHLISTPSPARSVSPTDTLASLLQSDQATSGTIPPGSRITLSPSGTAAVGGGGGSGNPSTTDIPKNAGLSLFPIAQVAIGNYVPIIVGRGFIQLLNPFYQQILLHEPIRQLTSPGGAPYSALAGSPAISLPISAVMLIANIGSGFSAGATFLDTSYCTSVPCPPRLSANPWVINVVVITLVIQAIAILAMLSQWWKKPQSLCADPISIAGVAVVMGHPRIEEEFSTVPADITAAELARRLKGRKYKLGNFQTASGIMKFGIMPVEDEAGNRVEKKPGFFSKIGDLKEKIPFIDNWRNNRFYWDAGFQMLLLALLGLTCAALACVDKTEVVFLATAAASGTGMRIFLAVLGTIVSFYWGGLFRDMQTLTPYVSLGRGDAEPDPTILLQRHTFPLTAFLPLMWKGHFTAASVAFTGLAAEFLIIALAGLPYRPGQQRGEFLFWSVLSLTILTLMVVQLFVVMLWRRRLPVLTRPPDTIAAVMTYVAGTGMSRDFESLSMVKTRVRNSKIKELGKSYGYGWRREEDGRARWVVDEARGKEDVGFGVGRADSF